MLACVIVTLSHDVGHPGKTNRFLILSGDELAIKFNDLSVLEMFHSSTLFSILKKEEFNILSNVDYDSKVHLRKQIIELILATDMESL